MTAQYRRVVIEALKFLEPRDLLCIDLVCSEWQHCSRLDEVWTEQLLISPEEADSRCVRDVCREQLTQPHIFAHFRLNIFTLYDLCSGTMKSAELSKTFIPTNFGAWVSLPNKVLYCGGAHNGYEATSFLIDIHSFAVERLSDMITTRTGGGLLYVAGRVYVFGGYNDTSQDHSDGNLSVCEKFTLKTKSWTALPSMQSCRRCFSPTLLKDRIYIAGGASADNSVEVFDIHSERFSALSVMRLQFTDALSSVFSMGTTLVVLANTTAWEYDIVSGTQVKTAIIPEKYWYSPGVSICYKGVWYFGVYYDEKVWKLDADLRVTPAEFRR